MGNILVDMGVFDNLRKAFYYRHEEGVSAYFMSNTIENVFDWLTRSHPDSSESTHHTLIKITDVKDDDMVLDVGCGELPYLGPEDRTYRIVGLDKSRGMLEGARKKGAISLLIQGDAKNLPFEDDSFDAVISKDVLNYVSKYRKAVEEIYRVVKPGRKAAIMITPLLGIFRLEKVEQTLRELSFSDVEIGLTLIEQKKEELKNRWEEAKKRRKKFTLDYLIRDLSVKLEIYDKEERKEFEELWVSYVCGIKPI